MTRRLGIALVATALASAAGCKQAADRVFQRPTVKLRAVGLGSVGAGGGALDVVLLVDNPNPYTLSAQRVSYRLLVDDSTQVASGATTQPVSIAGHDTALVHLPLDVTWRGLRDVGRRALADGTVDYRVVGEIVADTPIGAHTFPFDQRGRFAALSVSRLP
jgi:LEA14-like dessication related protein